MALANSPYMKALRQNQEMINNSPSSCIQCIQDTSAETSALAARLAAPVFDPSMQGAQETMGVEKENRTGLPDNLKAGVEHLSGFSMDDVRVHYNSAKPQKFNALAYTQGSNIHVGPGQRKHLPHEA